MLDSRRFRFYGKQVAVLSSIAIVMTVGVYGLVAGIVKLDDAGLWLSRRAGDDAGHVEHAAGAVDRLGGDPHPAGRLPVEAGEPTAALAHADAQLRRTKRHRGAAQGARQGRAASG